MSVHDYIRERFFPHMWCAGCGHGTILNGLIRAVAELGIRKRNLVMVTGIGCSARISGYVDFHSLHTIHGRALAFATGVKLSKPELHVIVPMGDGDGLSIGGNHFIHAARRNINLTALIMNNRTYGMTGGQFSPMSGLGIKASTAPYENIDNSFDCVELAKAAGATFVARTTTFHVNQLSELIKAAIQHKGFAVVEIFTQCPTYFGRKNRLGGAPEMLKIFKERTVPVGSTKKAEDPSLIERGIFVEIERPEYCDTYQKLIERAQEG